MPSPIFGHQRYQGFEKEKRLKLIELMDGCLLFSVLYSHGTNCAIYLTKTCKADSLQLALNIDTRVLFLLINK